MVKAGLGHLIGLLFWFQCTSGGRNEFIDQSMSHSNPAGGDIPSFSLLVSDLSQVDPLCHKLNNRSTTQLAVNWWFVEHWSKTELISIEHLPSCVCCLVTNFFFCYALMRFHFQVKARSGEVYLQSV